MQMYPFLVYHFLPNFRWKLPERSEASLKVSEFNVSSEGKFFKLFMHETINIYQWECIKGSQVKDAKVSVACGAQWDAHCIKWLEWWFHASFTSLAAMLVWLFNVHSCLCMLVLSWCFEVRQTDNQLCWGLIRMVCCWWTNESILGWLTGIWVSGYL